jgi:hypothetical protein
LETETGNEVEVEPELSPAEHTSVEPLSTKVVVLSGVTVVVTGVIGDVPVAELLVNEVLLVDKVLPVVMLATDVEAAIPKWYKCSSKLEALVLGTTCSVRLPTAPRAVWTRRQFACITRLLYLY